MNKVFNMDELPERRISTKTCIALRQNMPVDEVVRQAKHNMARLIADKIMERPEFFNCDPEIVAGSTFLTYWADCVVLTSYEYAQLKKQSFKEGMQHAQNFMPMEYKP